MRHELAHVRHPNRTRLSWAAIYILLIGILLLILYVSLGRVRTYSLPTGGVSLSVPYSSYLVGETVSFTVHNGFNSSIFVSNSCPHEPLSVYRKVNGTWTQIHDTTDVKNCATQDRSVQIAANSNLTATFAAWPHLFDQPGDYRVALLVQYYNAVPYQDFSVITPPPKAVPVIVPPVTKSTTTTTTQRTSDDGRTQSSNTNPQVITITVNSAGNYSSTSLTLHLGDSLRIVYSAPIQNEVRTRFTPTNGTSATIRSMTVDGENTTITRTMTARGTWLFKADDHAGTTGTLTVL